MFFERSVRIDEALYVEYLLHALERSKFFAQRQQ